MNAATVRHPTPPPRALRHWLLASAIFTLGGALLFGIPNPSLAALGDLPPDVPAIYRLLATTMMLLFGGAYAWLAMQPRPDRTLVVFGALAKLTAFAGLTGLWLASEIGFRTWSLVSGDLVFALAFLLCLKEPRTP